MKTPEWLKELREWLTTLALVVIAVLGFLFIPEFFKRSEADRKEREALLKYVRETTPQEHIQNIWKVSLEQAAKKQAARDAGEK